MGIIYNIPIVRKGLDVLESKKEPTFCRAMKVCQQKKSNETIEEVERRLMKEIKDAEDTEKAETKEILLSKPIILPKVSVLKDIPEVNTVILHFPL